MLRDNQQSKNLEYTMCITSPVCMYVYAPLLFLCLTIKSSSKKIQPLILMINSEETRTEDQALENQVIHICAS